MTEESQSTEEETLLERSSFGTDAARSLSARTTPDQAAEALRRAEALQPPASPPAYEDSPNLVELHQAMAELLASRGNWREAYRHLRAALDLVDGPRAGTEPEPAPKFSPGDLDVMTGAYTRRYLDQWLDDALTEPRTTIAVALVDLDGLNTVNNTYGDMIGDRVLAEVAELLLLPGTFCARYGGDEFALVFTGKTTEQASAVTEELRAKVERFRWDNIAQGLRVTISAGVTDATRARTADQALRDADSMLYTAKRQGGNVVIYNDGDRVALASGKKPLATATPPIALRANRVEAGRSPKAPRAADEAYQAFKAKMQPRTHQGEDDSKQPHFPAEPDPDTVSGTEGRAAPPVIGQ